MKKAKQILYTKEEKVTIWGIVILFILLMFVK